MTPLTRDLSPNPVSSTSPAPFTPKCHTSSPDPASKTISGTKPWSKDYIGLLAYIFCPGCRSNRGVCPLLHLPKGNARPISALGIRWASRLRNASIGNIRKISSESPLILYIALGAPLARRKRPR
ncbi:hypothetical protein K435DRAFT_782745 [Dendrothele bispora CBS 962.96]|uniref:Uncharacterized protein n=1 Tax=Dendrothele bispora (strain CBS 962.96) TaxID=1314807 RepID=A0A4S8LD37_DENBC|nr:hypothetical protein K435DRAFT_782745 [Dendrothele bispora CBS 962.96]